MRMLASPMSDDDDVKGGKASSGRARWLLLQGGKKGCCSNDCQRENESDKAWQGKASAQSTKAIWAKRKLAGAEAQADAGESKAKACKAAGGKRRRRRRTTNEVRRVKVVCLASKAWLVCRSCLTSTASDDDDGATRKAIKVGQVICSRLTTMSGRCRAQG